MIGFNTEGVLPPTPDMPMPGRRVRVHRHTICNIHIYMYIHLYVCMYVYMYVCIIHIYVCIYLKMCENNGREGLIYLSIYLSMYNT
jgi:hypothetical protein